jgi:hypothetical protein
MPLIFIIIFDAISFIADATPFHFFMPPFRPLLPPLFHAAAFIAIAIRHYFRH